MQTHTVWVQVAEGHLFRVHGQMAEAIHLLRVWSAFRRVDLQVGQIRASAAGNEKTGRVILKFQVLHVMVVTREIDVHLVFAEQWVPLAHKNRMPWFVPKATFGG
jgi:hypothetical protein